jgi:cytochrome c556
MKRFAVTCAGLTALGVAMVACSSMTAANNLDDPTIKEIMDKVNKGKDCLKNEIDADIKGAKWDDLSTKAKELVPLAKALGKNDPPKGSKESWKKLTDSYAKAAEDLDAAATKKDATAAATAFKGLTACGACHMAHRPK